MERPTIFPIYFDMKPEAAMAAVEAAMMPVMLEPSAEPMVLAPLPFGLLDAELVRTAEENSVMEVDSIGKLGDSADVGAAELRTAEVGTAVVDAGVEGSEHIMMIAFASYQNDFPSPKPSVTVLAKLVRNLQSW